MIVNDKNEVQPCRLLPRDIGREAFFFLPCQSIHLFSVFLYHYLERNGTEQNRKMDKQLWNKFECSCLEIFLGGKVDWFWILNGCGTVDERLWNRKMYLRHLWLQGLLILFMSVVWVSDICWTTTSGF